MAELLANPEDAPVELFYGPRVRLHTGLTLGSRDTAGVEWRVTEVGGWNETGTTGTSTQRTYRHGVWVNRAFYPGRVITITGEVFGPLTGTLAERWRVTQEATHRLLSSISLDELVPVTVTMGGQSLMVYARQDGPQFVDIADPGDHGTFSIQLLAADPRRLSAGDRPHTASTGLPSSEGGLTIPGTPTPRPTTKYFTDFTEHPIGAAPVGWSDRWVPVDATIAAASGATGGQALRLTSSAATARVFYAWDAVGPASNVEVVGRYRVTAGGNTSGFVLPGLAVRAGGDEGTEQGYRGFRYWYQGIPRMSVQGYEGGAEGDYSQSFITLDEVESFNLSQWQWVRLRVHQSTLYARAWDDGTPEPMHWQTTHPAEHLQRGLVGLGMLNACTVEWDRFGVGLHGAIAPTEALE